ncbi:MAG: hypothetical protein ABIJ31_03750 [Pseudomonadota bacterium]
MRRQKAVRPSSWTLHFKCPLYPEYEEKWKQKKYELFSESINNSIQKIQNPIFSELNKIFEIEIAALYEKGILAFEDDYKIAGFPLECKVKKVFEDIGFSNHKSSIKSLRYS